MKEFALRIVAAVMRYGVARAHPRRIEDTVFEIEFLDSGVEVFLVYVP